MLAAPIVTTASPALVSSALSAAMLPAGYTGVVENIPEQMPVAFRDSARVAAHFLHALESGTTLRSTEGEDLSPAVERFARQMMSTGFIFQRMPFGTPPSWRRQTKFPKWVTDRKFSPDSLTEAQRNQVGNFFQSYLQRLAVETQKHPHGVYHYFDIARGASQRQFSAAQHYKLYIENAVLLNQDTITKFLDALAEHELHPHVIKLYEKSRLVLHWNSLTLVETETIQRLQHQFSLNGRGPAQDGITFFMEDGTLKWKSHLSNDAGLGESEANRFVWQTTEYSPEAFFEQWLRLTAVANKLPHDPYRLAFVTALAPEEGMSLEKFVQGLDRVSTAGLEFLLVRTDVRYDLFDPTSFNRAVIGTYIPTRPT